MKKLLSLMLALMLALSMAGTALAADGKDDGKITIWTWDPTFNIAAMEVAKEMFKKDHPDVEVTIENVQYSDIEMRVSTAAAAGDLSTLPDILLMQDNSIQKYRTNYPEVYFDLTGKFDLGDFSAAKLAYSVVDGKNYGIPFDAGTAVATWRTDFLEKAGYTVKDLTDITWERFMEIGRDVKAKTNMPMLSGQAGAVDTAMMMLLSCGSSLFNEDGSVNMKNNEDLKEVVALYTQMVKEGIFVEVNSWDEYIGTMTNASVVGTINGCWILSTVMSLKDQKGLWDITNVPALVQSKGATNYSSNGGSSWMLVNGKDTDLALEFMKAYINPDFYNTILPTTSAIASFTPAKEGAAYTAPNEFYNGKTIFVTILEYGEKVPATTTGAYYYDAREALGTAITNVLNGGDVDSELATAEDTVNFNMGL